MQYCTVQIAFKAVDKIVREIKKMPNKKRTRNKNRNLMPNPYILQIANRKFRKRREQYYRQPRWRYDIPPKNSPPMDNQEEDGPSPLERIAARLANREKADSNVFAERIKSGLINVKFASEILGISKFWATLYAPRKVVVCDNNIS